MLAKMQAHVKKKITKVWARLVGFTLPLQSHVACFARTTRPQHPMKKLPLRRKLEERR